MDFDKIIEKDFNGIKMSYAYIYGNEKILLIKVGQDGTLRGKNDKYIKIGNRLKERYGISVIVASNHFTGSDNLGFDIKTVKDYIEEQRFLSYELNFMGYSNGALVGAWYGYKYPEIKNMLLVNAPLSKQFYNTMDGIKNYNGNSLTCVYGSLDTSYMMASFMLPKLNDKLNLEIVHGADHHFTGLEEELLSLPENYLFSNLEQKKGSR